MKKEFNKCSECGKKFKKGDLIIPRYDKPKLKMHMEAWKCKKL